MKTKISLVLLLAVSATITLNSCKKKGCTDPTAINYNADAKADPAKCVYHPFGALTLSMNHHVNGEDLVWDDVKYTNKAGNQYSVATLKYFISDITLNNSDGEDFFIDMEHYVDGSNSSTMSFKVDTVPNGNYTSVTFKFGLSPDKNKDGYFTSLDESNMAWPPQMGSGYHYMKLEGKYQGDSTLMPFNVHTGATMGNDNHITITLDNANILIENNDWSASLQMDINQWFENPNTWDMSVESPMIMGNQNAQERIKANGQSVFSLDNVQQLETLE